MHQKMIDEIRRLNEKEINYNRMEARAKKMREEMEEKGRIAYNKGLWEGLGFFHKWLYPILMKK